MKALIISDNDFQTDLFKELKGQTTSFLAEKGYTIEIMAIGKEIDIDTASGEFIGISKVFKEDLQLFNSILDELIAENVQNYYDLAYKELSEKAQIRYFYTNGLKWTEIDDKNDWGYANTLIEEFDRL